MRTVLFLLPLVALAACDEPMINDSDVVRYATEPVFSYNQGGRVQPTSCQAGRASSYSGTPPGCARDVAFARQIANPQDMVAPRQPAPGPAGPLGRAADAYSGGQQLVVGGAAGRANSPAETRLVQGAQDMGPAGY